VKNIYLFDCIRLVFLIQMCYYLNVNFHCQRVKEATSEIANIFCAVCFYSLIDGNQSRIPQNKFHAKTWACSVYFYEEGSIIFIRFSNGSVIPKSQESPLLKLSFLSHQNSVIPSKQSTLGAPPSNCQSDAQTQLFLICL
jgi:hypothetical protein